MAGSLQQESEHAALLRASDRDFLAVGTHLNRSQYSVTHLRPLASNYGTLCVAAFAERQQ
jgi:hypothetical protein